MACVCKAYVGKPAPEFQATAVVDGAFKEVKLSDYKGEGLDGGRGGGGAQALEVPSTQKRCIQSQDCSPAQH